MNWWWMETCLKHWSPCPKHPDILRRARGSIRMLLRACFVIMPEKELEFFEKSIFFSFFLWYDDKQDFYVTRAERQKKERSGASLIASHFGSYMGICLASPAAWVLAGTLLLIMYFEIMKGKKDRNLKNR